MPPSVISPSAGVQIGRKKDSMNNEGINPYLSSPPLLLDTRIEPSAQLCKAETSGMGSRILSSDERLSSFSSVSSTVSCTSRKSGVKATAFDKSRSNASFSSLHNSSNNSISSICSSSSIRRHRLRNSTRAVMMTNSNSSISGFNNNSNGSLCSISSGISTTSRRSLQRQKSRSFESLRDSSRHRGLKSDSGLNKNHSFESVATLQKRTSSGCFSQASKEGSCNSSGTNFSWSSKGIVQMAQRSNGATVKGVIDDLRRIVEEAKLSAMKDLTLSDNDHDVQEVCDDDTPATETERPEDDDAEIDLASLYETAPLRRSDDSDSEEDDPSIPTLPLLQCSMLAQWARVDSYYKVVITKYQGIPVIIRAMDAFASSEEVQASSCIALANLTNKVQIFQQGGPQAILNAMKGHPHSISVQSAALEALVGVMPLIQHLEEDNTEILRDIQLSVMRTEAMFLTGDGKIAAKRILEMVNN